MPAKKQKLAKLSPATCVLAGMREALPENATMDDPGPYIWPLPVAAAIAIPIGLQVFNPAERYASRTGKLKRNGYLYN